MEHKNKKIKPKIVVAAGISREDIRIVDEGKINHLFNVSLAKCLEMLIYLIYFYRSRVW